ncbi:MAG: hypothetical protein ACE14S_03260 [Candidatus Bathyarchaeia archaeon]
MKTMSKAQSLGSTQRMGEMYSQIANSPWRSLYKISTAFALTMVVIIFPIQIIAFSMAPLPTTAAGWFTLLQNNSLLGLLDLDVLIVVDQALLIPITIALYIALRRVNKPYMALATISGIVGAVIYSATNNAFSMLYLSNQHAAATTDAQRAVFLAAGETAIATSLGTGWYVYNILGSLALLIPAVVMLRSNIFSKATAYTGIVAGTTGLAFFVPTAGIAFLFVSAFALQVWFVLIARKLYHLGK